MVAAILEGTGMTIDVAKLRRFAEEAGWPSVTPMEFVELLDAYEERDHLRALLERASTFVIIAPWSTERVDLLADIDAALEGRE